MKLSNVVASPVSGVYKAPLTVKLGCPDVSVAPTSVEIDLDPNNAHFSRNISKSGDNLFFNAQSSNSPSGLLGVYDTKKNTITSRVACPYPTFSASFIYVNGSVYIIGGYNPTNNAKHNKIMRYDGNLVTTLAAILPEEAYDRSCNAIGNYIYIIGGETAPIYGTLLSTIYRLDTTSDTLEKMTYSLSIACKGSSSAVYQNRYIYVVAGYLTRGKVQIIDTEKGSVSLLSKDLPVSIENSGAMIKDDFLYVFGGFDWTSRNKIYKKNLLDDDSDWVEDTQTLAYARDCFGYTSDENGYYHIIAGRPTASCRYYETGRFGVPSSDVEIRYTQTTDGTIPPDPTYADTLYTAPIELTTSGKHKIKAKAFYIG